MARTVNLFTSWTMVLRDGLDLENAAMQDLSEMEWTPE